MDCSIQKRNGFSKVKQEGCEEPQSGASNPLLMLTHVWPHSDSVSLSHPLPIVLTEWCCG